MPHRLPRLAPLLAGLVFLMGTTVGPDVALAARQAGPVATYLVALRAPDGRDLPARRGGLRARAASIAQRRAALTARTIDALETQVGFSATQRYTHALSGFAARLGPAQLAMLRDDPRVAGIRRDRPVALTGELTPAGIRRVGAAPGPGPAVLDDVMVAVVDTGVGRWLKDAGAWRHAGELNVVGGVNAYDPRGGACAERVADSPAAYDDTYGHGTHVAGTIGARSNDVGVVGVAPGVRLLSVRVFQGLSGTDATVICGLDWIAAWNAAHAGDEANDIDVVNMSLRGYSKADPRPGCDQLGTLVGSEPIDLEEAAVCAVVATGATVTVAAGNEADEVAHYTPSRYESVITVAAISDFDGLPGGLGTEPCVPPHGPETDDTFSRYSNFGPEVDIAAPGTCVRSTDLGAASGSLYMSGTSMAAPHVAGAAARYLGQHPGAGPAEVRTHLLASATTDWDAATDPDGHPDRLVDVAALVATEPDVAVQVVPLVLSVPGGTAERTALVRLQRIGGYAGPVTLSADGGSPPGVRGVAFGRDGQIPAGLDADQRSMTVTFDAAPADGVVELVVRADGEGGTEGRTTLPIRFDGTPPVIAGAWPHIVLRKGTWQVAAPVRLSWTATDAQGALAGQALQRSRRSGGFSVYGRLGSDATGADVSMERRVQTRWRVEATDLVGNHATSSVLSTRLVAVQAQAAPHAPAWVVERREGAAGRDLLATDRRGAAVRFSFSGRAVAIVAPQGPSGGTFRVRLDGRMVGTVRLARSTSTERRLVWVSGALTPGPHTLKVVAVDGRAELDAFLVLR